jgi:NAD(P)-dependent dehydrogenase (short-subunit alcohol dehydrogenase family)
MDIRDHVFLVTGGGSGLGAACVRLLAEGGGRVVLVDVDRDRAAAVAAPLGNAVHWLAADVTDENAVQQAVQAAEERFGGLHGVIQCAGVAWAERLLGPSGPHRLDSFLRVLQVNLVGTFNVARLAAVALSRATPGADGERGVIINTASIAAFEGQVGQAAYAASKGGVAALTLPLARELARWGIRVVTIAPGLFDTPLLAGLPEAARQALRQQVLFPPRLGRPEEFAALVRQVVENPMLNGVILRLDGAVRLPPR